MQAFLSIKKQIELEEKQQESLYAVLLHYFDFTF